MTRIKSKLKRILRIGTLFACGLIMLMPANTAQAFDTAFYNSNDVIYYDPDACSSDGAADTITGTGTVGSYTNPVYNGSAPDPAVIAGDNGMFYVYATGGTLLESKDMASWKKIDDNWKLTGAPNDAGGARWAPDVAKVGEKYILTYTIPTGTSEHGGGGSPKIGYAIGDSPGGAFAFKGTLNLSYPYSIDSHIFSDGGKLWLFWGGGAINVIQLSFDGSTLKTTGSPKQVLTKGGVGSSATIEGSWVTKRNGWYYLTYSQGHYDIKDGAPAYRVLVARSKTVNGNYTPSNSMRPLLEGKAPILYPGHHSIVTDSAGNDWIVYHGYYKGERSTRSLNIDPITYDADGWPVVNGGKGPSSSSMPGSTSSMATAAAATAGSTGSKISVFGDSLTVGMRDEGGLKQKLTTNGWTVQDIEAKGGENIAWARTRLKDPAVKKNVSQSDTVLIAMGTNADDNPKAQVEGIVQEVRDINPDINIYWVNIFTPKPNQYRDNMNEILDSSSSDIGFNVIDWHSEVKDKTDFYAFIPGNIHHTPVGYQRKTDFVVKTLTTSVKAGNSVASASTAPSETAAVCCKQADSSVANVELSGKDNAAKIFNFLTSTSFKTNDNKPLNTIQAAAFIGNFSQESGLDPEIVNSIGATGIVQWLGGRKDNLMKMNNPKTLETQLQFIKIELEGDEKAIMSNSDFKAGTNIEAITVAIRKTYERPGAAEANDANRIEVAKKTLQDVGGGGSSTAIGGPSTTPTDGSSGGSSCGSDSSTSDLGPGTGAFKDSGEVNGWSIVKANAILTDKEFGSSLVNSGYCAAIVARVFGAGSFGNWKNERWGTYNPYAISMWYQFYKTDKAHADRNPKKGAWLFYEHTKTSASDAGHIVIYLGDNKILNDGQIANADYIEKTWHMKYLGWIDPNDAGISAKSRSASELHSALDGYKK